MRLSAFLCAVVTVTFGPTISVADERAEAARSSRVRFAAFNIWELSAAKLARGDAAGRGTDPQLRKAAEIIQRVRPDVLLVNEIDFDAETKNNAARFLARYLKVSQRGQAPIDYPHIFFEAVNTGVPTGLDLDNDGKTDGPADAFGFGRYPGQYGMALYSRFPIDRDRVRTFRKFKWKDMPGNLMPDGAAGKPNWYSPMEAAVFRLSSKSHWDLPIRITVELHGDPAIIHVLASHPTPPVFDGPEDRNGRRNFDEIRLWADYIAGGDRAAYLVDDAGARGGLGLHERFVVMGDLNADPAKGPRDYGQPAIEQLLKSPRVRDPAPRHSAAGEPAPKPLGNADTKTADFGRLDYVLPSSNLRVIGSGVFWPATGNPLHDLVSDPAPSSDHRLVWVDLEFGHAGERVKRPQQAER